MGEKLGVVAISQRKLKANRRNSQLSTGPKTQEGKANSRRNALKHGMLASSLLITEGEGAENTQQFLTLVSDLHRDLKPIGTLEGLLVEKIAVCWWRQKRALQCEAGLVKQSFVPTPPIKLSPAQEEELILLFGSSINQKGPRITDHLRVPLGKDLDRILRYETTIQRQLVYTINQLERLQRLRKGEAVPAPVALQVTTDH